MTVSLTPLEKFWPVASPLFSVVTLVNDPMQYMRMRAGLAAQHEAEAIQWIPIDADGKGWNAAAALNHGLEQAEGEWVVCAHQDVLFPEGWWGRVLEQIEHWKQHAHHPLGVVGLMGVTRWGRFRGAVSDPHGDGHWAPLPARVASVDEHVIIIRRESGLRFDPATPGFHGYGTDIARESACRGLAVIAIDAPVIHLSGGTLDEHFHASGRWLLRKWNCSLLPTCAAVLEDRSWRTILRSALVRFNRRRSIQRGRVNHPQEVEQIETRGNSRAA